MLTLVTAVRRNPRGLAALHADLRDGLDDGLCWVIQDSAECPETLRWAAANGHPAIAFHSAPDRGIYDALNAALRHVATPYYLVVGSDDSIDLDALRMVVALLALHPAPAADVMTFPVRVGRTVRRRQRWWPSQVNVLGLTACHSVGTIIRRDLHDRLGPYDTRYRILADSLFLRRVQLAGGTFRHHDAPVPGTFSLGGVSSRDLGRVMRENFSYNVECGSSVALQAAMFVVRMLAYRFRL